MVSRKIVLTNPTGLHLRPAGFLCKEAGKYKSSVHFNYRNATVNAKSVLSILGACVKWNDEIEIVCSGPDEKEALDALIKLIESGLGE